MDIPLIILLVASPFGAFDVTYFHLWKFRLYQRPESVKEETTHILRGFLVPLIMVLLLAGRPEGRWFWIVLALFAFDALNTLLDVVFEPASRAPRIVPPAELSVHFLGTTMMGAAFATFILAGWDSRHHATALAAHTASILPDYFFSFAYGGVVAAFVLVTFETSLFIGAVTQRARLASQPAR